LYFITFSHNIDQYLWLLILQDITMVINAQIPVSTINGSIDLMRKIVMIKPNVTHTQLFVDEDHFYTYIKNKPLVVLKEFEKITLVEDRSGVQFTLRKTDLISALSEFALQVQQMREAQRAYQLQLVVVRRKDTPQAKEEAKDMLKECRILEKIVDDSVSFLMI
jgi:hypothetical protein